MSETGLTDYYFVIEKDDLAKWGSLDGYLTKQQAEQALVECGDDDMAVIKGRRIETRITIVEESAP